MCKWQSFILTGILAMGASAQASFGDGRINLINFPGANSSKAMLAPKQDLAEDQWLAIKQTTILHIMEQVDGPANDNVGSRRTLTLLPGTRLTILSIDAQNGVAEVGIPDDISANNKGVKPDQPVRTWVSLTDLAVAKTETIDSEYAELYGDDNMLLSALGVDSEWAVTDVAGPGGMRAMAVKPKPKPHGKGGGGHPMTYCLADVYYAAHRFTSSAHIPAGIPYAAAAYGPYRRAGWSPIAYSTSVPLGTACFFSGGRYSAADHAYLGHAAIKIGPNAWKGAGVRPTPFIPGRNLIGCLVPPKG